jgi:hypothetical protein
MILSGWLVCIPAMADGGFVDVTDAVGLGPDIVPETVSRVALADLTGNGYPDAVIDRHRVFLNVADDDSPIGRRFVEVSPERTGLLPPVRGTVIAFADMNNNGRLDAIVAEYVDLENPDWLDHGRRTGWHEGHGDGTFGPRRPLPVPPRTTVSIAIGDVNADGYLDIYLGNAYRSYGRSFEGFANDLLISDGEGGWRREPLPEDEHEFSREADLGGRPTYGTMILNDPIGEGVMLLELSYGRRWNRAWVKDENGEWVDIAPHVGLDGDDIRHGRHPEWLRERAKTDPRFDRADEPPFRANGNTFDAAIGDVNGNGRFDLFLAEITHGWAGDSSDRSRFLFNELDSDGRVRFVEHDAYNVDRIPPAPDDPAAPHNWNHGDLFAELADLDHRGRIDLLLSSGDYPDNQRLRIYRNTTRGVEDVTAAWGIDHDGSQQISLADVNGNGALDILVGQTFNRFTAEQREGRSPRIRLFQNQATAKRMSVTIRLVGDGVTTNRNAIGAIVIARIGNRSQMRQLIGPGGHAGKQHDLLIHFGLGNAEQIDELTIIWPNRERAVDRITNPLLHGRYEIVQGLEVIRILR